MKEIHQVIEEIEFKINGLRSDLSTFKSENSSLKAELQLLNEKLIQREAEAKDFQEKYNEIVHQKVESQNQGSMEEKERELEIDALVREIEDCISKLKGE